MNTNPFFDPLKYARIEVERRFLLDNLPSGLNTESIHHRIKDNYIPDTRLRLRRVESPSGEVIALKLGQKYRAPHQQAYQSVMTNIYLNADEYRILAQLGGRFVTKRRYPYIYSGELFSIDIFEGNLKGLILMEIEKPTDQEILSLQVPEFALREVTDDPFFSGWELAKLTKDAFQQRFFRRS